ncbi:MAG: hypothetical protein IPJ88_02070 [Myxococcales bacterium]|nr:MAG: hypothetical protein IPJ88_02070 [Myxococcales bacterium]
MVPTHWQYTVGLDPKPNTQHDRIATLGREPVRIDIFTYVPGPSFEACYEHRLQVPFGVTSIDVLSK